MLNYRHNLVVGSVFVPHERSEFWYNIQIQFLKETCGDFVHIVCVNGVMDFGLFSESKVIQVSDDHCVEDTIGFNQSCNHSLGLAVLLKTFRSTPSDSYLILDSDCFPIMKNWREVLLSKMIDQKFAAPIRFENLDVFSHPCSFFIKGRYIFDKALDFEPGKFSCLLGFNYEDVGARIPLNQCYPLIRSNFYNPHPVFSAIYNHMFYHHGCGSRALMTRSIVNKYFDHYLNEDFHYKACEDLFLELKNNTRKFLKRLTGGTL
jgi:hypothetical protein